MHAAPFPVHGLPSGTLLGWPLWAYLKPVTVAGAGQPAAAIHEAAEDAG